jgi:hypothetical protein
MLEGMTTEERLVHAKNAPFAISLILLLISMLPLQHAELGIDWLIQPDVIGGAKVGAKVGPRTTRVHECSALVYTLGSRPLGTYMVAGETPVVLPQGPLETDGTSPPKARLPMDVRAKDSISMRAKLLHPLKASTPIEEMLAGRDKLVRPEHP